MNDASTGQLDPSALEGQATFLNHILPSSRKACAFATQLDQSSLDLRLLLSALILLAFDFSPWRDVFGADIASDRVVVIRIMSRLLGRLLKLLTAWFAENVATRLR